ncbi:hypothetical protein KM043_000735 [Ampulex compressa]|nr:hypothetical protein KM043_000735 [Ampulex compressa]
MAVDGREAPFRRNPHSSGGCRPKLRSTRLGQLFAPGNPPRRSWNNASRCPGAPWPGFEEWEAPRKGGTTAEPGERLPGRASFRLTKGRGWKIRGSVETGRASGEIKAGPGGARKGSSCVRSKGERKGETEIADIRNASNNAAEKRGKEGKKGECHARRAGRPFTFFTGRRPVRSRGAYRTRVWCVRTNRKANELDATKQGGG